MKKSKEISKEWKKVEQEEMKEDHQLELKKTMSKMKHIRNLKTSFKIINSIKSS